MVVSPYASSRKRGASAAVADESKTTASAVALGSTSSDDDRLSQAPSNFPVHSNSAFTLSDVASLVGLAVEF
ncbi:unnamed protein product [Toxocara canis]|nr:unnamed protein product [Toxocara canis]